MRNMLRAKGRRYVLSVESLEDRQLMSTVNPLNHTVVGEYADVDFKSWGGYLDADNQYHTSVGAKFEIDILPVVSGVNLSRVDYSTPHSLDAEWSSPIHDDTENSDTRMVDSYHNVFLSDGTDFLSGYFDEHVGTTHLAVTVSFQRFDGGDIPDPEEFDLDYLTYAPTANMNATFPTSVGIGPMAPTGTGTDGYKSWVPWGRDYAGVPGYNFGATPNKFQTYTISVENETPNDGYFSTVQFVKGTMEMDAVDVTYTGNFITGPPEIHNPVTWETTEPITEWLSDVYPGSDSAVFKLPTAAWASNYADQPSPGYLFGDRPILQLSAPLTTSRFLYGLTYADDFETDVVWTPTDGTPIVVATQPWQLRMFFENATSAERPTWDTAYGTRSFWYPGAGGNSLPSGDTAGLNGVSYQAEIDTPSLLRPTTRNATWEIQALMKSSNGGWHDSGSYKISDATIGTPGSGSATTGGTTVADAGTTTTTGTPTTTPTGTQAVSPSATSTGSSSGSSGSSGYPAWADNSSYPGGVLPPSYWTPWSQGAEIPLPPGTTILTTPDGPIAWQSSWGAPPVDLWNPTAAPAPDPGLVAQAPPSTPPPVTPPATPPDPGTPVQDQTAPGLPVPPYATNITSTSMAASTAASDPPTEQPGWMDMGDHWWNFFTGEGYQVGDTLA